MVNCISSFETYIDPHGGYTGQIILNIEFLEQKLRNFGVKQEKSSTLWGVSSSSSKYDCVCLWRLSLWLTVSIIWNVKINACL